MPEAQEELEMVIVIVILSPPHTTPPPPTSYLLSSRTYITSNHLSPFSEAFSLGQPTAVLPHAHHHTFIGAVSPPRIPSFPPRPSSILYKLKHHFSDPQFPFCNLGIIPKSSVYSLQ